MEFASDNTSGATPEVMAAVNAANAGYAANGSEMDTIRRSLNLCALAGVSATDRK